MNLDHWLHEATATFPAGVQKRLAQEYRSHLDDSIEAGGSSDPLELFGPPSMVRKHLKSLYLDEKFWIFAVLLRSKSFLTWMYLEMALSLIGRTHNGYWMFASLLMVIAFWLYLRVFYPIRRTYNRQLFYLSLSGMALFLSAHVNDWFSIGMAVLGAVMFCVTLWALLHSDARLRRTLELEGLA